MKKVVVAITGASGSIYAKRLLEELSKRKNEVFLVYSDVAKKVFKDEIGIEIDEFLNKLNNITVYDNKEFEVNIASGSFKTQAMIICPCSSGTLGKISSGICDNLITRSAHVHLKERRTLILMLRESPLNSKNFILIVEVLMI